MNIHDIARIAGVSASTVSKVMNGRDKDISEETRKRVLQVIEEEHYVPYLKFREKERLKNRLIGLVIGTDHRERDTILQHIERAAYEHHYGVVVRYVGEKDDLAGCVDDLACKQVSGVIIDSAKKISCGKLENTSLYICQTKDYEENQRSVLYYHLMDAGRLASRRLIQEGHQKIACIIQQEDHAVAEGYKSELQDSNISYKPVWLYEGKTIEEIEKYGIRQCIDEKITAVICGSPRIACSIWKIMERARTVIPNELSMIVIGDGCMMDILGGGITAVQLPVEDISRKAVESVIEKIQGNYEEDYAKKFLPRILERGSIVRPPQEKQGEKIVIVGSMNMDITMEVSRIPVNGETQLAEKLLVFPGGKGGNQAVGAGKLGGQVYMIGCLGNDVDGKQLYTSLMENHVHMDGVVFHPAVSSGKAYISVDQEGESTIVVYQGANRNLTISQINGCRYLFQSAKYCLLSMEIPDEIVEYTIKLCKRTGTEVILKPSATEGIKKELLEDITYFVPNEKELNLLIPGDRSIEEKAGILRDMGVENVIVTMGANGCLLMNSQYVRHFAGSGFVPVDTTGGADSFISALAVCLSEGKNIIQAIGFAIYASGITVTRYGVQPALPDRKAVDVYEDEIYMKFHAT